MQIIYIVSAFAVSSALWRIGGWHFKWVRRYILPAAIALYSWLKSKKWKSALLFPILIAAFSIGYGEDHPYWQKFLTGIAWILPRFILRAWSWSSIIAIAVPFIWIALFWLSNNPRTSKYFKWFWVEVIIGGLVGVSYS